MLGFIPTARFDDSLEQHGNTIWQSTWLVLKSDETKGQGQAMLREVLARHAWTWTGTVGLSPGTRKIYEALGYRTGVLGRYYLLNPAIREFTLAEVPPGQPHLEACGNGTVLTRLDPDSFMAATEGLGLDSSDQVPRKTRRLIYNRYVLHPFYRYDVFLARAGGRCGPRSMLRKASFCPPISSRSSAAMWICSMHFAVRASASSSVRGTAIRIAPICSA